MTWEKTVPFVWEAMKKIISIQNATEAGRAKLHLLQG